MSSEIQFNWAAMYMICQATLLLGKEMTRGSPPLRTAKLKARPGKFPTSEHFAANISGTIGALEFPLCTLVRVDPASLPLMEIL